MNEFELVASAMIFGSIIPVVFYGVYWLALDQAKSYADKRQRETKEYVRDNFERDI